MVTPPPQPPFAQTMHATPTMSSKTGSMNMQQFNSVRNPPQQQQPQQRQPMMASQVRFNSTRGVAFTTSRSQQQQQQPFQQFSHPQQQQQQQSQQQSVDDIFGLF
jgi:transcription initiation factor TFIID subunit TAF12